MSVVLLIISSILISLSCIGIGDSILKFIDIKNDLLKIPLSFFTGEVILSFVWITVCFFLPKPFNMALIAPILIYGIIKSLYAIVVKFDFELFKKNKINLFLFCVLISILLFYFVNSFTKPYEWDEISYHFPVIQEISRGEVSFPLLQTSPYINFFTPFVALFGNLPYSSESFASILYTFSLNNSSSAHVLFFINFLFFIVLTNSFLYKFYKTNLTTNLMIDILVSLSYGISIVLSTGLVDVNLLIYQFLALFMAILSGKNHKYVYLFICFASYALGQKYTSLFMLTPSVIYLFILYVIDKNLRHKIGNLFVFLARSILIFFVSGGVWYVKNLVQYRNPVYPLYLGHPGMNEDTYNFLMESLIYGLKIGTDFKSFLLLAKTSYINETGLVFVFVIIFAFLIFRKLRFSTVNILLAVTAIFVYLINFYLGSQLSRFILIVPYIFYVLSAQIFLKYKYVGLIIVLIAIISIRANPLQWSNWNSRFKNEKLLILGRSQSLEHNNIGCLADVANKLKNEKSMALNLWDPYAASFFNNENILLNMPNTINLSEIKSENFNYVYINNQYKKSFLADPYLHRDMNLRQRLEFEENLTRNKKPVFSEDNCLLFLSDTQKVVPKFESF